MPQPSTLFPLAQGLSSAPHPPQAPSRACRRCNVYGISGTRPKSARMAHPTRHTDAHPLSLGPPGCLRLGCTCRETSTPLSGLTSGCATFPHTHHMDACGLGATVGASSHRQDNPSAPPPPVPAWLCCQCPVNCCSKRASIVPRASGFQGSRVNGFQGLNGFRGSKSLRVPGFKG